MLKAVAQTSGGGGGGTVTQIVVGTGLNGGTITTTGTISLANTSVVSGTYGNAYSTPVFTVNAQGQLTGISLNAISIPASAINTSIPNSSLANSSITIGSTSISLGGTATAVAGLTSLASRQVQFIGSSSGTVTVQPAAAAGTWTLTLPTTAGAAGNALITDGTGIASWGTVGAVTSVQVSGDSTGLTFTGGPITTSGTITMGGTLGTGYGGTGLTSLGTGVQGALGQAVTGTGGIVLATSPTLITPNLGTPSAVVLTNGTGLPLTTGVTGVLPIANGGLGLSTAPASGQILIGNGTAYVQEYLTAGSGISITNSAGSITIASTGGGGSVTSVSASGGTTGLTFSGSPITTAGTITLGGTLAVASGGTGGTATPTAGAVAFGNGSAYAFTAAGTSGQVLTSTGSGTPTWSTPSTGSFQPAYYGTFVSTSNQSNGGSTTANPVSFDTTVLSNGISITSSNRITFANAGVYVIMFELAVSNSTGSNPTVNCWLAQNGTNIANTTSDLVINGGANQPILLEQQWIVNAAAGDYVQIYWASSATTISLVYQSAASSPTRPASPSAIVNVALLPPSGSNLVVGSSTVSGGTSGRVLYDNAGVVGEYTITGTAGSVVMSNSPTLTTPALGTPSALVLTNATGLPLTTGVTGILPPANGGTGQTTASAAFNALSPITSTGDLIIGNGVNSATRLGIGANTYVLTSNGTTAAWAAPTGSTGPLIYNTTTISSNQTVVAGQNALSVGPMTINSGSTVTVASGQRWLVL